MGIILLDINVLQMEFVLLIVHSMMNKEVVIHAKKDIFLTIRFVCSKEVKKLLLEMWFKFNQFRALFGKKKKQNKRFKILQRVKFK